ncbi:MAG: aminotransferase class V-fold PLP-dependent enzyme, partial [Sciscionella sp.]|nr:aminotransferase class V-fold PLP-dependent enzyme [Sciscionella sp.]
KVRAGFRAFLGEDNADIALGANTHELVLKFLSCLDFRRRPKLVTTDGEFHSARRQLARLAEEGIELERVPARPVTTLAQRLAERIDGRTSAVMVSAVLFETGQIVPHLDALADACRARSVELLVDAYHALGPVPMNVGESGLTDAWITGGGYKYLQLGEGNAFLRLPAHADDTRPVITGWFAEFGTMTEQHRPDEVAYPAGADRFAGATYDPTSNFRAAKVFDFFAEHELTPTFLHRVYQHQIRFLADRFDDIGAPIEVIDRDRSVPLANCGGFLALRSRYANRLRALLAERGVAVDSRGDYLRLGPAPYLSDEQLAAAVQVLGEVLETPEFRAG